MVNSKYQALVTLIKHNYARSVTLKTKKLQKSAERRYKGFKKDLEARLDDDFDWDAVQYPTSNIMQPWDIEDSYRNWRSSYITSMEMYPNTYEAHTRLSDMLHKLQELDQNQSIQALTLRIQIAAYYDLVMQFSDEMTCHLVSKVYNRFITKLEEV